jgi:hypothetical protein
VRPSVSNNRERLTVVVRSLTLAAAEIAFVALVVRVIVVTWQAEAGTPPDLPGVQVDGLAALAVVLGVGYALVLGVPTPNAAQRQGVWAELKQVVGEEALLFIGVILYMLAGFAISVTYALNEAETPEVLKTITIAFGGYVLAYISAAYQQLK